MKIYNNYTYDMCFKLICYYKATTEMFDRTLTDERSMYDKTEAFVDSNNTVRKLSNKNAINTYKKVLEIANSFRISSDLFNKEYKNQLKLNHFSAQDWIEQYNLLCKNGEMDIILRCL